MSIVATTTSLRIFCMARMMRLTTYTTRRSNSSSPSHPNHVNIRHRLQFQNSSHLNIVNFKPRLYFQKFCHLDHVKFRPWLQIWNFGHLQQLCRYRLKLQSTSHLRHPRSWIRLNLKILNFWVTSIIHTFSGTGSSTLKWTKLRAQAQMTCY